MEVIRSVERVTRRKVPVRLSNRRPGDPAVLVAASDRLQCETGWTPGFTDLDDIVRTAWHWRKVHPFGYADHQPSASAAGPAERTRRLAQA